LLGSDPAQRVSLMFGLGMNNNGTGLVLASVALAAHPRVMLPIIAYNLVQHLVAGTVTFLLGRGSAGEQCSRGHAKADAAVDGGRAITGPVSQRLTRWNSRGGKA